MLMEQFLTGVPNEVMLWLKDQKPKTVDEMARLADQYFSLRKPALSEQNDAVLAYGSHTRSPGSPPTTRRYSSSSNSGKPPLKCWFCRKVGHKIADCRTRINNEKNTNNTNDNKSTNVIHDCLISTQTEFSVERLPIHLLFELYCKTAHIVRNNGVKGQIKSLRDTGSLLSVMKRSSVHESDYVNTGKTKVIKGIGDHEVEVPLIEVHLQMEEFDKTIICGLVSHLPEGVDFLLGNDLASEAKVTPNVSVVTQDQAAADKQADESHELTGAGKTINDHGESVDTRQRLGKYHKPSVEPLVPLPVIMEPTRIAIDSVSPLPNCPNSQNRFIPTVLDLAKHDPESVALHEHTAQTVAKSSFELRNGPGTFQRLETQVQTGIEMFTGAYIKEMVSFSNSGQELFKHSELVFDRIRKTGLTLKKAKCVLTTVEVKLLKYQAHTVRPPDRKQVRFFLGIAGFVRKFIPLFVELAVCLANLLWNWILWTDNAHKAYVHIESRLASRPILHPPDFSRPLVIAVDASSVAIGANLLQVVDGIEHSLCCFSRRLNSHQQNYATIEKEALALILAVIIRMFSVYCSSHPVTVERYLPFAVRVVSFLVILSYNYVSSYTVLSYLFLFALSML